MADSKAIIASDSWSPEFIQELLPSAERTALLYHLSYLCLGGFPNLERLLRKRAVETQMLFGSSEAILMKCVGTSENLVTSLLPSLRTAAEKNKPQLALKFIEKAKNWISDIITDVKVIVEKYEKHNSDVAASTSDIITEKEETEKKQQKQTSEMEAFENIVDTLDTNLRKIHKQIEDNDKKIEEKDTKIQEFISSITSPKKEKPNEMPGVTTTMGSSIALFSMIVPFVTNIIDYICKVVRGTYVEKIIKTLQDNLSKLTTEQQHLKEKEWNLQNQLMDKQLNLAKIKIENGQLPSVTHLDEVRVCLSRIQQILILLLKFWEKVVSLLDTLKNRTLTGEVWIEDLDDMKEEFLKSIDAAQEGWTKFGLSCMKANNIFSVQASQAYRFLEINPSSLSEEDWEKEYKSVKEKLERIRPKAICPASVTQ